MKDRLRELLEYLNISIEVFAVRAGISPDLVRKYLRGFYEISESSIRKLARAYPQININWLRTGEGNMISKPDGQVAYEPGTDYSIKDDAMDTDKDFIIKVYKEIIKEQRKIIEDLSKLKNVKNPLDQELKP